MEITDIKIEKCVGKGWFITGTRVDVDRVFTVFLHNDGNWRKNTMSKNRKKERTTCFYETARDAAKVADAFVKGSQNES